MDEANNGEDREKTETSAESKEAVVSKGSVAASSEWRRHYSRKNPRLTIRISVCLSDSSWSERFPSVCPTAPPYPVGIVPPRTKSPIGSPESCTIASYVTLRKTRRSEPRSVGVVLLYQSGDEVKPLFWGKSGQTTPGSRTHSYITSLHVTTRLQRLSFCPKLWFCFKFCGVPFAPLA